MFVSNFAVSKIAVAPAISVTTGRVPTRPGKPGKMTSNLEKQGVISKTLEEYFET